MHRAFGNALQFQAAVGLLAFTSIVFCSFGIFFVKARQHLLTHLKAINQNKVPRLHKAHRWRMVGSFQQTSQHWLGNGGVFGFSTKVKIPWPEKMSDRKSTRLNSS